LDERKKEKQIDETYERRKKIQVDKTNEGEEPEKGIRKQSKKVGDAPVTGIRSCLTTTMATRTVATRKPPPMEK